ncbi:MAG: aspartate aminotransferase family protein [Pyrinomonadaceae bacterium]
MNFQEIRELEDRIQVTTYAKLPLAVERGEGAWVWTSEGEKYLDLYGGHAVCATGHSHPLVVDSIKRQAERMIFYSNLVYSETRGSAAERLASVAPDGLKKVFFCSSGTEANENAMRMARMSTGREKIVSFSGGFHGRTADSISATFLGKYREIGKPNVPGHVLSEFGDIESVRAAVDQETAAVIIEPIQSMSGVREAPPEFFVELKEFCEANGAFLIFDEVQTGVGRTGNWFFAGSENAGGVVPDIVSLAKSLGSGIPVGACLTNDTVAGAIKINDLGTTFGGGMLAMAAVHATIDAIEEDAMLENASRFEWKIREIAEANGKITGVRGKGCLLGLEFAGPISAVHQRLLEKRIITGTSSDPNVLRLLPPLCTEIDDLLLLADALNE